MPRLLSCLSVPSLVLYGCALILSSSSNGIPGITPKDPYRFIQVFLAMKHWVCQHKFPVAHSNHLFPPFFPHPTDNFWQPSCLQSATRILRFSIPGSQPCRSLLAVQELVSCNGLSQASSQTSTFNPSPCYKQHLKDQVWLKMQPRPEAETCLYLSFTAA